MDSDGAVFWDDGAALAMLLQHPNKVQILGVTTVIGNHWPYQGAEYLARVLRVAGREDIPLFIGSDEPLKNNRNLLNHIDQTLVNKHLVEKVGFWKGAYSRAKEVRKFEDVEPAKGEALSGVVPKHESAVDFIVKTLNDCSRPITFVAIGPLTNLAVALQKDPSISKKIKRLLVMGGNIDVPGNTTPFAELNFLLDPEAAQIVLASEISQKILFPLDISNQITLNKKYFLDLTTKESPYTNLLKTDRGPKFSDEKYILQSWDTLVSAFLIDPTYVLESHKLHLEIVTKPNEHYGSVKRSHKNSFEVSVVSKVNPDIFFKFLKADLQADPVH